MILVLRAVNMDYNRAVSKYSEMFQRARAHSACTMKRALLPLSRNEAFASVQGCSRPTTSSGATETEGVLEETAEHRTVSRQAHCGKGTRGFQYSMP